MLTTICILCKVGVICVAVGCSGAWAFAMLVDCSENLARSHFRASE